MTNGREAVVTSILWISVYERFRYSHTETIPASLRLVGKHDSTISWSLLALVSAASGCIFHPSPGLAPLHGTAVPRHTALPPAALASQPARTPLPGIVPQCTRPADRSVSHMTALYGVSHLTRPADARQPGLVWSGRSAMDAERQALGG